MCLSIIFSLFIQTSAGAEIIELNSSVKALGMGNAYISFARKEDAAFYNPAGFTSGEGIRWKLFGVDAGLNGLDVYDEYADIIDGAEDDLAAALGSLYGRPILGRTNIMTSYGYGPVSVGAYFNANVGFQLYNPAYPVLKTSAYSDYGYYVGFGKNIIPSVLDFGIVGRSISRIGGETALGPSTLVDLDTQKIEDAYKKRGTGYAADVGVNFRVPAVSMWRPILSFVWKDIGDTALNNSVRNGTPDPIQSRMHAALSIERAAGVADIRGSVEVRDVNGSGDVDFAKKLHAGVEINLPAVSLRGGFNQGYYTAGLSLDLWLLQIDAATYGVELGEYAGQHQDRRYIVQVGMEFQYVPGQGLVPVNRKGQRRRRKKERR